MRLPPTRSNDPPRYRRLPAVANVSIGPRTGTSRTLSAPVATSKPARPWRAVPLAVLNEPPANRRPSATASADTLPSVPAVHVGTAQAVDAVDRGEVVDLRSAARS